MGAKDQSWVCLWLERTDVPVSGSKRSNLWCRNDGNSSSWRDRSQRQRAPRDATSSDHMLLRVVRALFSFHAQEENFVIISSKSPANSYYSKCSNLRSTDKFKRAQITSRQRVLLAQTTRTSGEVRWCYMSAFLITSLCLETYGKRSLRGQIEPSTDRKENCKKMIYFSADKSKQSLLMVERNKK